MVLAMALPLLIGSLVMPMEQGGGGLFHIRDCVDPGYAIS